MFLTRSSSEYGLQTKIPDKYEVIYILKRGKFVVDHTDRVSTLWLLLVAAMMHARQLKHTHYNL